MNKFTIVKNLFFFSLLFVVCSECNASLNLYLNYSSKNDLTVHTVSQDIFSFTTTGQDPYISTTGFSRDLLSEENVLQFEYKASGDIDDMVLFFGPHFSGTRYMRYSSLPATDVFRTVELDLSEALAQFSFGVESSNIRMDFGSHPDIDITIRNIRITNSGDESPWDYDNSLTSLNNVLGKGLPVIEIWTDNEVEPTCDLIMAPEGCMGNGITNAVKVSGRLKLYEADGTMSYDSGDYVKGESGVTIKVRGNSSAYIDPKPYKVKLEKKNDLLRRGNKDYNDKNWVLLRDYEMKIMTGFIVNQSLKLDWTPQCEYVSVIINGYYRGIYLLAEGVERNTDCRIDVSKTGFITELDPYWWNENGEYLESNTWNPSFNYTLKYPDYEDADAAQLTEIGEIMNAYEQSLVTGNYDELIDCESFARALLAQDILGIYDWCGSNMYFSKYDNTGNSKLRRPTLWDFDSSEMTPDKWSDPHLNYYNALFDSANKSFTESFINLWNEEGIEDIDQIISEIKAFKEEKADSYNYAVGLTRKQFGLEIEEIESTLNQSIDWYTSRKEWLKSAMADLEEEFNKSSVDEIEMSSGPIVNVNGNSILSANGKPFKVYSLQGINLTPGKAAVFETTLADKGIYIIVSEGKSIKITL